MDPRVCWEKGWGELSARLMPHWGLQVEGWLFRSLWFVPSERGDPRLGVACRTELLLSSGAGLVP